MNDKKLPRCPRSTFLPIALAVACLLLLAPAAELEAQQSASHSLADTSLAWQLVMQADSLLAEPAMRPEALRRSKQAVDIFSGLSVQSEYSALAFEAVALAYYYMSKKDSAIVFFQRSLEVFQAVKGAESAEVAIRYHNLATVNSDLGRYDSAIGLFETSIAIKQKLPDPCTVALPLSYRMMAHCYHYLEKYEDAIRLYQQAIEVKKNCIPDDHPQFADNYNDLGIVLVSTGDYKSGLESLEKARRLYEAAGQSKPSNQYLDCLSNLARCQQELGYLDKARVLFRQVVATREQFGGRQAASMSLATAYNNLGDHFIKSGEFGLGLEYCKKAATSLIRATNEYHPHLRSIYSNIGVACAGLEDHDQARYYQILAIQVYEKAGQDNSLGLARSYHNIGGNYEAEGELGQAMAYYQKAIRIWRENHGAQLSDMGNMYNALANIHYKLNQMDSALACLDTALSVYSGLSLPAVAKMADIHTQYGIFYQKTGDWEQSGQSFEAALRQLQPEPGREPFAPAQLKRTLQAMSWYCRQRFRHTQDPGWLRESNRLADEALAVLGVQAQKATDQDKTNYAAQSAPLLEIKVASDLQLLQLTDSLHYGLRAFSSAERNKGFLLFEALRESNALQIAGIPDSLLRLEQELKTDLAYHDRRLQRLKEAGAAPAGEAATRLEEARFDLNRRYEQLKSELETNYPRYYQAKYELAPIALREVQRELLRPGRSLLEFLVGDSAVYTFLVRTDTFLVHETRLDFPLENWVRDMTREGIHGYYPLALADPLRTAGRNRECTANYTRSAWQLYEKLLAPLEGWLTPELVVIPDGVLGYLPFEALLTAPLPKEAEGRFSHYEYLLKKHQVSYCYSATLLRDMRDRQHREQPERALLAMAPFFQGDVQELRARIDSLDLLALRDSLGPLPASGEEVAVVAKLLKGDAWYGAAASVETFRREAGRSRILHLSTHGKADDRAGDYAYLAFGVPGDSTAFDKLYARDLYSLSLNADMVVLSACETGIGRLRRGEGVVSMARAFAYAGARSIFTTLWQVSDSRTAGLLRLFYKNLARGMARDAALRQAKLDYLKNNRGEASHPFFWAGMIGIGDMGEAGD